jgi:hypothetical protein
MTTREFLEALFAGCDGLLEFRLLPQNGEAVQQFRPVDGGFGWLDVWEPDGRVDAYFGVYPRTKSAGTADAIAPQVWWLYADQDVSEVPIPPMLAPTIMVESGTPGHRHYYWRMAEPVAVATAEAANKVLAHALGTDLSATDRARVMRLPGTINSKTGRMATVTHYHADAAYRVEDLLSVLATESHAPAEDGAGPASPATPPVAGPPPSGVAGVLSEGSRNASLTSLAGTMRRAGMRPEEIVAGLLEVNRGRCQPPLPEQEVRGIATSIGRYGPAHALGAAPSSSSLHSASDGDDGTPPIELRTLPRPRPRRWTVEGLLPAGVLTVFYGDGGMAKSYQAMFLGDRVARGECLFGRRVEQGRVLYLDWELTEEEQTRRAYQVAAGLGYASPAPGLFYREMARSLAESLARIRAWIAELRVSLVILDSFGLATLGDATAAKDVVPLLHAVSRFACTSLFIDHVRNLHPGEDRDDMNPFGSAYKRHVGRSLIHAVRVDGDGRSVVVLLRQKKSNFSPLSEPLGVRVVFADERVCFEQEPLTSPALARAVNRQPALQRVWQALLAAGRATPETLASTTSLKVGTVKNQLTELRKRGKATLHENGVWEAVAEPSSSSPGIYGDDAGDGAARAAGGGGRE